ncbi:MAG TPA: hypothetical protein PK993_00685 [Clostridia bacterium]|nr:hypothetical protein [Clostridia bacterium]
MHTLRKKLKNLNSKLKDNKDIIIIQENNKINNNSDNIEVNNDLNYSCSKEEIDDFVNDNSFKIIENINGKEFSNISVKSSDNSFYIKDNITDDYYISSLEDLGDDINKIIVMRKDGKYCDYYSYLMRNDENELIKIAIISLDNSNYCGSEYFLNNNKLKDMDTEKIKENIQNDSINRIDKKNIQNDSIIISNNNHIKNESTNIIEKNHIKNESSNIIEKNHIKNESTNIIDQNYTQKDSINISDKEYKFKKIVVTNSKIESFNNRELLEYAQENNLGNSNDEIEDLSENFFESDEENDVIQEYLKIYNVKVNGKEVVSENLTKEVGNAMIAVDEEEYYREDMLYLLSDLRNLIKIKIESTQGIKYDLKSKFEEREI